MFRDESPERLEASPRSSIQLPHDQHRRSLPNRKMIRQFNMPAHSLSLPPSHMASKRNSLNTELAPKITVQRALPSFHELEKTVLPPPHFSFTDMTTKQKCSLISIAMANFFSTLTPAAMEPFFPKLASDKGLTETESGVVFSSFAPVVFVSSLCWGKAVHLMTPRTMYLTGTLITGLSLIGFSTMEAITNKILFLTLCLVTMAVEGIGYAALMTASYTVTVDDFADAIGTIFGSLEVFSGLGMIAGPTLGGLLYRSAGFWLIFTVIGVLILFVMLPISYCIIHNDWNRAPMLPGSIKRMIIIPGIFVTCLVITAISTMDSFLAPTLEPHLRALNLKPELLGLVFLINPLAYTLFCPLWGCATDHFRNMAGEGKILMIIGIAIALWSMLCLGPSPLLPFFSYSMIAILVSLFMIGVAKGLALVPTFELMFMYALDNDIPNNIATCGIMAGIWGSADILGEMIGPLLGGTLTDAMGFPWSATIVAGILLIVFAVLVAFTIFETKQSADTVTHASKAELQSKQSHGNTLYMLQPKSTVSMVWSIKSHISKLEESEAAGLSDPQIPLPSMKQGLSDDEEDADRH